jgi:hypothetical protein
MRWTTPLTIQANRHQELDSFAARNVSRPTFAAITETHQHIFQYSETEKRPNLLKRPRQTAPANPMRRQAVYALAAKPNLTSIRSEGAAHEIKEGCLPRPVGPHHPHNLAGLDSEVDVLDGSHTAKALGDFIEREKRHEPC